MTEKKVSTHGGARLGAGRKKAPIGKGVYYTTLTPSINETVNLLATKYKTSRSEIIERAIKLFSEMNNQR